MDVSASEMLEALRRSGLRITSSRRAICEVLAADHHNHMTANDLLAAVNKRLATEVAPSTIYRTIDALKAEGLLDHVNLGPGPAVVHLTEDETHHHLVCEVCGRKVDIDSTAFDDAIGSLAKRNRFDASSIYFALIGRCEDCAVSIANELQ